MPSLVHGQPISAEEIERIVSREFSPETFVLLCNSVAWASTGKECSSLPSFTERIYAPDGGRDAEWTVEIASSEKQASALLSSGWNVYQYKHRDVSARNRAEIVSKLKADLKGALKDLINRHKRKLSKYVLFVNLHLTLDEQNALKAKIRHDYDENESTKVEVVEAAFLASCLNNLPHLRSSFFSTSQFMTWQQAWFEHENRKIYGANISLTGRDEKLNALRILIDNPEVRAVIISGAKDIGKTRLALEATKHHAVETVVSVNRSIEASDLRYLKSSSSDVVVLVEDPDLNKVKELINQILSLNNLKLIITVPTSENSPTINFGLDERIKTAQLSPLSEEESRELLKAADAGLDYTMKSSIVKQAGGNPGILLLAAKQGAALRKEYGSFLEQIAKVLEKEVQNQIGTTGLEVLKLLSLLEYVGIKGRAFTEIKTLCKWFRLTSQPDEVSGAIQRLTELGFLQIRGMYAEVTPPLFANHLAASMLKGKRSEFLALFADLDQEKRSRLIRRLQGLDSEKIAWFWNEIFNPNGLLRDLSTAISNREILYLAACANPPRTIRLIEQSLKTTNLEERKFLQYSKRDALVWTLEELIFYEGTSLRALRCLGLVAETEPTNTNNNSATGKFCQCFRPLHSQIPLSLQYRLDLLKQFSSSNQSSVESRLLVIEIIKTTLNRWGYHFLREGRGNKPSDPMPQMTWSHVWNYQENLLQLLIELVQSNQSQVAEAARQSLPQVIAEFSMLQFSPETTISAFQKAVDWVVNQQISLPVSKLANALHSVYDFYKREKDKFDSDTEFEVEKLLKTISTLLDSINKAEFAIRLKRWAGRTDNHGDDELDEHGTYIRRDEREAQILAQEVISKPSILTDDLLHWLCLAEAQEAYKFCFQLGRLDIDRRWLTQIEQIGIREDGLKVFSVYCGGLSQVDRQFVSDYLDKVTQQGEVRAEAIVAATQKLGGDIQGINRVVRLIRDERVDPRFVEYYVFERGKWLAPLNSDEYLYLLKAIANTDLSNAAAVVKSLWMWLHLKKTIEGRLANFAWNCLEVSNTEHQDYHCFDKLALHLVKDDVEKGFELLEKLLLRQLTEYQYWHPINSNAHSEFWHFLYSHDRKLSIEIPLKIAVEDSRKPSLISWHLQKIINQEENSDVLTEFAKCSEAQAKVVCDILSSKSSVFWQIAFEIITQYPESQDIKNALSYLVVESSPLQSRLEYLRNGLNLVGKALSEKNPPFSARLWLDELRSDLQIKVEEEQSSQEADLPITSTSMQLSKAIDSERIWAIRRLLNDGETEKIRQLLSQGELSEIIALPDLSETERQKLQDLLKLESTYLSTPVGTSANVNISSVERLILMSNQSPIFNQQNATIGVNYASEGSKQEFTQNVAAAEQNFEVWLADFEQFINDLQQKYPNATDETAIQIIDVEAKGMQQKQPVRWQNFLNLKRLWNGGKKATFKVGEHYAEQNPLGKGAIAFLEGVMEEPN